MPKKTAVKSADDLAQFETWTKAKLIPIDMLVIPDWNVNEMEDDAFGKLLDETKADFDEPAQIVRIKDGPNAGKFLVPGGAHRVKACIANGETHVPCVLKKLLEGKDELEIEEWAVARNNTRGRLNTQKVADLQKRMSGRWGLSAEAAKRRLLLRDELVQNLKSKKSKHVEEDNETTDSDPNDVETIALTPPSSSADEPSEGKSKDTRKPPKDGADTDGAFDKREKFAERRALIASLKSCVQEVLIESEETVEHGYLYFGQGGQTHLVVNESKQLHVLVADMVAACKANSDKVDDFLTSAISKELPTWQ